MSKKKLTLEDACAIARNRGGQCLSTQYTTNKDLLLWCCSNNHEWRASLSHIKYSKSWYPHCAKVACYTIKDRCSNYHEWYAHLNNIKNQNQWCPYCANRVSHTIEDARQIAINRNRKCLLTEYINIACHSIEDAKKIAISRNRDCISTIYYNNHLPLLWRCENNYIFTATLNAIKNQHTWYPFCSKKHKDLCRKIITKYLGSPSPIRKPDFLKTPEYPTGLELDISYYDYGFVIEVQGIQHEHQIKFFHPNFEDFEKQQTWDQLTEELCEENWIALRY
ncbi:19721_t:CDS:2, partial [Racocetra persica]